MTSVNSVSFPRVPLMSVLRPISAGEYSAWLATVVPQYACDKVDSGQWCAETALDQARKEFSELLPEGKDTAQNYLYTILSLEGTPVGTLWFREMSTSNRRFAYVYDILILAEYRRRGHATRAFQTLESEVTRLGLSGIALHVFGHNLAARSLYEKLGYSPTSINMFKSLSDRSTHDSLD